VPQNATYDGRVFEAMSAEKGFAELSPQMPASGSRVGSPTYAQQGYLCGSSPLFLPDDGPLLNATIELECQAVPGLINRPRTELYWDGLGTRFVWYKSLHAHSQAVRLVAAMPALVSQVAGVLGPDLVLWGSELIRKGPGQSHRWHVDTECERHGVTVWLPLENVGPDSGLMLMTSTHRCPRSPQHLMIHDGLDLTSDEVVLAAARSFEPESGIVIPRLAVGEFVLFEGMLWHASFNRSPARRSVLVLQYSAAGSPIRVPRKTLPPVTWHDHQPPLLHLQWSGSKAATQQITGRS